MLGVRAGPARRAALRAVTTDAAGVLAKDQHSRLVRSWLAPGPMVLALASFTALAVTTLTVWLAGMVTNLPVSPVAIGYIPVVVAGFFAGLPGGLLAALGAGLAVNPWFPLAPGPETGLPPDSPAWLARLGLFCLAGGVVGLLAAFLRRGIILALTCNQYDTVTGLPTRQQFEAVVEAGTRYNGGNTGLHVVAINMLPRISAAFGSGMADAAMAGVARRLQHLSGPQRMIFRIDHNTFGVAGPGGVTVGRMLARSLAKPVHVEGIPLYLEPSVGTTVVKPESDAGTMVRHARAAAVAAYEQGRRHQTLVGEDEAGRRERLHRLGELSDAIGDAQFFVVYQPKICLRTGRVCGAEALVRWQHPRDGLVPPGKFIPLAEETALMPALTEHILLQVAPTVTRWARDGAVAGGALPVAVNISARDLQDPELVDRVLRILAEAETPPHLLELEITESVALQSGSISRDALDRFRQAGLMLAIDDYGTGHSALNHLRTVPATTVKIDKAFVGNCPNDTRDAAIVRSSIALAHALGFRVVAEGVEDAAAADLLRDAGCDMAQGFHFGRPMSESALVAMTHETAVPWNDHKTATPAPPAARHNGTRSVST